MDSSGAGSSDRSDDDFVPSATQAAELVNQFAQITATDTACAQFYLQDRNWNLERSVEAYFGAKQSGGIHVLNDGDEPQIVLNITKDVTKFLESATTRAPTEFRLITWNLDGLDDHNLKIRTKAVKKIIESLNPDIVFLQELVPKTLNYLEENLPQFKFIPANNEGYFTATLLNQFTVYYDSHRIIKFPNTTMDRNLLQVDAHIGPLKLKLLNTHLESTGEFAEERMSQLGLCFEEISKTDPRVTVVLGGDLNSRDKELEEIGGLPSRTSDVWESTGARKEARYTWDTMRNTNKQFPGKFKPRCRFDRVYLRPAFGASPHTTSAKFFGLIGLQKIASYQCFPSDHWGILADFDIKAC